MKTILLISALISFAMGAFGGDIVGETSATLNGLTITLDNRTGSILRMAHAGPGEMLKSTPESAGIVDMAYPVKPFAPLRLASRFSDGAKIEVADREITISWAALGASRKAFPVEGGVSASVTLKADPDGRSIVMSCRVVNSSKNDVRQVLFPDLSGLQPFAGVHGTYFRTCGFSSLPFRDLAPNEGTRSLQYMIDAAANQVEYQSGGMFNPMWLRWMDLGGLKGGVSLFPRRWGWNPHIPVRLHLSEDDGSLRLLARHDVTIREGETWESGEYVLTPHEGGWAKGIEPYREWVKQHFRREFPVPKHVREGLGFRTVWMCELYPEDPEDVIFKWSDMPKVAKDSREHGIDEMVVWAWTDGFVLPIRPPFKHLGTQEDMAAAVRECRKLGVNVSPFISVVQANAEEAPKYGLKVTDNNGWTYHTELIPRWNPPYATAYACVGIPVTNELWRKDVLASLRNLADQGIPSVGWDQFWTVNQDANTHSLTKEIRAYAITKDPEATFCGEELWNMEPDSAYLDYTWNWGGYRDCRGFTNAFPAPRINSCITDSALTVKQCFADNLYLNLSPRRKGSTNASGYIGDSPEMSKALKQCAALRKQFLPFFTEGVLIGECLLAEPCPQAFVCSYVLGDRAMMIMINQGGEQNIEFDLDLGLWIAGKSFTARSFDANGHPVATEQLPSARWHGKTPALPAQGMVVYEFTGK